MLLEVKSFVWKLVYASKSAFFLIQISIRSKLCIKISDQNKRIVTRGGGSKKGRKSVEWPLKPDLYYTKIYFFSKTRLWTFSQNGRVLVQQSSPIYGGSGIPLSKLQTLWHLPGPAAITSKTCNLSNSKFWPE